MCVPFFLSIRFSHLSSLHCSPSTQDTDGDGGGGGDDGKIKVSKGKGAMLASTVRDSVEVKMPLGAAYGQSAMARVESIVAGTVNVTTVRVLWSVFWAPSRPIYHSPYRLCAG